MEKCVYICGANYGILRDILAKSLALYLIGVWSKDRSAVRKTQRVQRLFRCKHIN